MNQSNWIGAFIVIGFVCYVIANNQLPGYLSVLGIGSQSTQNSASNSSQSNSSSTPSSGISPLTGLAGML